MKKTGIWLDKEKAHCFSIEGQNESFITIKSNLEFFQPKGGSRSKTRWGPQDVVQDSKYLEREKHQLRRYFKEIVDVVGEVDELVIFGPAEAPEKFSKMLAQQYAHLAEKVKNVEKAGSMTQNQLKALVKTYFKISPL